MKSATLTVAKEGTGTIRSVAVVIGLKIFIIVGNIVEIVATTAN